MEHDRPDGIGHDHPRSTAQIAGHPIHPMLIPFPIVCFIGTFVADIIYAQTGDNGWASASYWLLGIGLVLRIGNRDFIASTGVWLSGLVVLILLYSGWKGGDLV